MNEFPQLKNVFYGTRGPRNADIMFVGEAWGREEKRAEQPFVGASGRELMTILKECGIHSKQCFFTKIYPDLQPYGGLERLFGTATSSPLWDLQPDKKLHLSIEALRQQIEHVQPKIIIALGNFALWALCPNAYTIKKLPRKDGGAKVPSGIINWRGSMLTSRMEYGSIPVMPTLHPAFIMRSWEWRQYMKHDLRTRIPMALKGDWNGPLLTRKIFPDFDEVKRTLMSFCSQMDTGRTLTHALDIETRRKNITCLGIAVDSSWSICIPFINLKPDNSMEAYWTPEQELIIHNLLRKYLRHPNLRIIGQNFLYDMQYLSYYFLCPDIKVYFDTMLAQHAMFPGTPKSLDMLASLYCKHYTFWKAENKEWADTGSIEQHFSYNCTDVLRTYEIFEQQTKVLKQTNKQSQFDYLMKLTHTLFRMMLRGIRIDKEYRRKLAIDPEIGLSVAAMHRENWLLSIVPQALIPTKSKVIWPNSPKQTQTLFYDIMGLKPQKNRKTKAVSVDDESMERLKRIYPEFTRMFDVISDLRSIGVFHNNFLSASVDADGRMRTSFNPGGTETFRLSSSKNAFGGGTNFQNIPSGDE